MIAANELRIGNWVMYDKPRKIIAIYGDCVLLDGLDKEVHHHNIEPIPLTPEILE